MRCGGGDGERPLRWSGVVVNILKWASGKRVCNTNALVVPWRVATLKEVGRKQNQLHGVAKLPLS